MHLLYSYTLVAIGLQINVPAASALNDSPTPARWQATACPSHHDNSNNIASTSVHHSHRYSASLLTDGRGMAFATPRRSYLYNGKVCGSTDKRIPKVSQLDPGRHFSSPASTKLYMLPEHIEHLSLIGQFTFFLQPLFDYIYDFITFVFGLSFMFVAASVFVPNNNPNNNPIATMESEDQKTSKSLGATSGGNDTADAITTGDDDTETFDDEVLTPGTYANSRMAKRQVKDTITNAASQAFDSTDFTHEPHLSPECEDVETAYEVALLANAAHELADAAERENRQSKAAMLERDKELEWIEKHEDENGSAPPSDMKAETFQQSLLAAQFANNLPAKQKQEAFQRSLLSARIANDAKGKQSDVTVEQQQQKEEWMGSEARAASMGGEEVVPFSFASAAASSAAAHVLEEIEHENDDVPAKDGGAGDDDNAPTVPADSLLADTAERMILTEDSPESSLQIVTDAPAEQQKETQLDDEQANQDIDDAAPVQSSGGFFPDDVSSVHQWRKDYMNEIQSYVQQKSAEQRGVDFTYGKSSDMSNVDDEIDSINVEKNESSRNGAVARKPSVAEGIMKRTQKFGIMKQLRQRQKFLIVALAVVLCRRLFLAYFGKGMRLI